MSHIQFYKKPILTSYNSNSKLDVEDYWLIKRAFEILPIKIDFSGVLSRETETITSFSVSCRDKTDTIIPEMVSNAVSSSSVSYVTFLLKNGSSIDSDYKINCRIKTSDSGEYELEINLTVSTEGSALGTGTWRDDAVWDDTDTWRD